MFQAKRQAAFSTWQAPGHDLEVVYSEVVMHEVVLRALDGLHSMPGVGLETGGVLFGTADEHEVRITASRELECAHAMGHGFVLNEADEARLERILRYYAEEPELAGLAPVGFYVSRTRNELALTDGDLRLFNKYFPEPQQVVLAVKVARGKPTRGGFFLREADGSVLAARTPKEFEAAPASEAGLRPLSKAEREVALPPRPPAVVPIRTHGEETVAPEPLEAGPPSAEAETPAPGVAEPAEPAATTAESEQTATPAPMEGAGLRVPEEILDRPKRHPWPWKAMAAAVACVVVLASVILYMRGARNASNVRESAGLRIVERGGFLLAEWDANSKRVRGQTKGALEVDDGEPRLYVMNETLLRGGQWRIITSSENVVVKLRLGDRGEFVESSRYVDPGAASRVARLPAGDEISQSQQARLDAKQARLQELIQANNATDALRETMLETVRRRLAAAGEAETAQPRPQVQLPPRPQPAASSVPVMPAPPPVSPQTQTSVGALPLGLQTAAVRPPSAPPVEQLDRTGPQFAGGAAPSRSSAPPASGSAAQTPAASAPAQPTYQGPRSGRIIWTGNLAAGASMWIVAQQASSGTVTGALPALPVRIGAYAAELGAQGFTAFSANARHSRNDVVETPSARNGWQRMAYQYDPKRAANLVVTEAPAADNSWQRMQFRAGSRPVTAILIEWELAQQ